MSTPRDGNPGPNERRQSLREDSVIDVLVPEGQHGAVGSSRPGPSNMNGGPINFSGMQDREPEGYGGPVTSTSPQGCNQPTADIPAVSVAVNSVASPGVAAFLATSLIIFMEAQREVQNAHPSRPSFLHGIVPRPDNPREWNEVVLPRVRASTFVISSTADLHFASAMLGVINLPWLFHHITSIIFPKLYWFSGVANNRYTNPCFSFSSRLPDLVEICFTLHTAGLTESRWAERQMVEMERTDPVRARERNVKTLQEVVHLYDLARLFTCTKLQRIRIEYIDCEMTAFFTTVGQTIHVLRQLQMFLTNGFASRGQNVDAELVRVPG